jgi:hypothetical protein
VACRGSPPAAPAAQVKACGAVAQPGLWRTVARLCPRLPPIPRPSPRGTSHLAARGSRVVRLPVGTSSGTSAKPSSDSRASLPGRQSTVGDAIRGHRAGYILGSAVRWPATGDDRRPSGSSTVHWPRGGDDHPAAREPWPNVMAPRRPARVCPSRDPPAMRPRLSCRQLVAASEPSGQPIPAEPTIQPRAHPPSQPAPADHPRSQPASH